MHPRERRRLAGSGPRIVHAGSMPRAPRDDSRKTWFICTDGGYSRSPGRLSRTALKIETPYPSRARSHRLQRAGRRTSRDPLRQEPMRRVPRCRYPASHGPDFLPLADELEALNEPYRLVTGNELTGEIGAPYFTAAVYASRCVLLNPAALCRGLADMLPHNVVHYEKIPVTGIDYSGGLTLTTAQGENRAPRMILTVNGCAQQFGFFQRRLLSFAVPASLSRPLTQDECKALGGKNEWGLTATHGYVGTTMRMTHDQRILIRQNVRLCPGMNDSDAKRQVIGREHKKLLDQRFPMLPNVTMEHTWTGYVCASRNGSPGFGRIARTPIPPSARTAAASREAPSQASWRPTGHAWSTTRLSPRSRSRARQTGCRRARSSMWAFTPSWHGIVTCIVTRCDMIFCCAVPTGNPSREREP